MDEPTPWLDAFGPRDQQAIDHARLYAQQYQTAGIPGHNQLLIIAKMAAILDARDGIAAHYAIDRTLEAAQ